jgi:hypothetical protein
VVCKRGRNLRLRDSIRIRAGLIDKIDDEAVCGGEDCYRVVGMPSQVCFDRRGTLSSASLAFRPLRVSPVRAERVGLAPQWDLKRDLRSNKLWARFAVRLQHRCGVLTVRRGMYENSLLLQQ